MIASDKHKDENAKNQAEVLCGEIKVSDYSIDIQTNRKVITFDYFDYKSSNHHKFKTDSKAIQSKRLPDLLIDNGIEVKEIYIKELASYIQELVINASLTSKYVSIAGFDEDCTNFYSNVCISKDSIEEIKQIPAFDGFIGEHGNKLKYDNMLRECLKTTELQLAFSLGFVAPLSTLLKKKYDLGTSLIALYGGSTKGKTTALMLAESVLANPSINQQAGFAKKGNGTDLSLSLYLKNIFGVTYYIDDISAFKYKSNNQKLIMDLEAGESKSHVDKDYNLCDTAKWSGAILFSSEKPLLNSASLVGSQVRLFSFKDVQWTPSGRISTLIKDTVSSNYGFYCIKYIQYLLNLDKQKLYDDFEDEFGKIKKEMGEYWGDPLLERTTKTVALISLASKYASIIVDAICIKYEEILEFLCLTLRKIYEESNVPISAYYIITDYLKKNENMFINMNDKGKTNFWGFKSDSENAYYVIDEYLMRIFDKANAIGKENDVLDVWVNRGFLILDPEGKRKKTRKTYDGEKYRCYKIKMI